MNIEIRDNSSLSADTVQLVLPNGETYTAGMDELCTYRLEEIFQRLNYEVKVIEWAFDHDVSEFGVKPGRQR